jgi:hypothetical protein
VTFAAASSPLSVHRRRLDDRIRYLCAQAREASRGEVEEILQELLGAVHEKIERLRALAANQLLGGRPPKERRAMLPWNG